MTKLLYILYIIYMLYIVYIMESLLLTKVHPFEKIHDSELQLRESYSQVSIFSIKNNGKYNTIEKIGFLQEFINKDIGNYEISIRALLFLLLTNQSNDEIAIKSNYDILVSINKDEFRTIVHSLCYFIDYNMNSLHENTFYNLFKLIDFFLSMKIESIVYIIQILVKGFSISEPIFKSPFLVVFKRFLYENFEKFEKNNDLIKGFLFKSLRDLIELNCLISNNPSLSASEDFLVESFQLTRQIIKKSIQKKNLIFQIGRELLLMIIQLSKSNIEEINDIIEILNEYKLSSFPSSVIIGSKQGSVVNPYTKLCISSNMEKALLFLVKSFNQDTFKRQFGLFLNKFRINNTEHGQGSIGIIYDIVRYLITNSSSSAERHISWIVIREFILIYRGDLNQSIIKQAIYFDWLFFEEDKSSLYIHGTLLIFNSLKDLTMLSYSLIEFIYFYVINFNPTEDNNKEFLKSIGNVFFYFVKANLIPNQKTIMSDLNIPANIKNYFSLFFSNISSNENEIFQSKSQSSSPQPPTCFLKEKEESKKVMNSSQLQVIDIKEPEILSDDIDFTNEIGMSNEDEMCSNTLPKSKDISILESSNIFIEYNIIIPQNVLDISTKENINNLISDRSVNNLIVFLEDIRKSNNYIINSKDKEGFIIDISIFILEILKTDLFNTTYEYIYQNNTDFLSTIIIDYYFQSTSKGVSLEGYKLILKNLLDNEYFLIYFIKYFSIMSQKMNVVKVKQILEKFFLSSQIIKDKLIAYSAICSSSLEILLFSFTIFTGISLWSFYYLDDIKLTLNLTNHISIDYLISIERLIKIGKIILIKDNFFEFFNVLPSLQQEDQVKLYRIIKSHKLINFYSPKDFWKVMMTISKGLINNSSSIEFLNMVDELIGLNYIGIDWNYKDFSLLFNIPSFLSYSILILINRIHSSLIINSPYEMTDLYFNGVEEFLKVSTQEMKANCICVVNFLTVHELSLNGYRLLYNNDKNSNSVKTMKIKLEGYASKLNLKIDF